MGAYRCQGLWFEAVELFYQGGGDGVAEAGVEVYLAEAGYGLLVQCFGGPAGVLFGGLLRGSGYFYLFQGGRDLHVSAVEAGVGDLDRPHRAGRAVAPDVELSAVEDEEVGSGEEQADDYDAGGVEARHAAHQFACRARCRSGYLA